MQNQAAVNKVRPSADVCEDSHAYYLDINMPGADSQSVKVEIKEKELQIHAAMNLPTCPEHVLAMEFVPMEYAISFVLSPLAQINAMSASLENGVLHLVVPKSKAV